MGQAGCYECRELSGGSCGWDGAYGEVSGIVGKVLTLDLGGSYRAVSFGTIH